MESMHKLNWLEKQALQYKLKGLHRKLPRARSFNEKVHIKMLISDTEDRLAVFKNNAYYDVPGDLDFNNFTSRAVAEGDYGISSHSSLLKVGGSLIGVGPLGFLGVSNGNLMPEIGSIVLTASMPSIAPSLMPLVPGP